MLGPLLLLTGIISFSLLDATNKLLSGTYGLSQAVTTRYVVMLGLLFLARAIWRGAFGTLRAQRPWPHILRGVVMLFSAGGFFLGFRHIGLGEGYLVFFSSTFITLILAAVVLREHVPPAAWFWCALGFGGVVLSAAPKLGAGGSVFGYAMLSVGTIGFAITQTLNRFVRQDTSVALMVLWPAIIGLVAYTPTTITGWIDPTPAHFAMLCANGIFAAGGMVFTAAAYRVADAARLGPFSFAALPVSVLWDWLLWRTTPDLWTILGGIVVVFACVMSERARIGALARRQGMVAGKA